MEELKTLEEMQNDGMQSAEMPNEEVSGLYVHVLKKPVTEIRGDKKLVHKELRFDFASLTGKDMVAIDRELQSEGESVFMRAVHPVFLLKVCARAAGVSEDVIQSVTAKEYDKITGQARLFFLKTE